MDYKTQDWFISLDKETQNRVSSFLDTWMWGYEKDLNWRLEQLFRPLDEKQLKQWYGK